MANIGFLGDVSVGKTSILRNFVNYVNTKKIETLSNCFPCEIVHTDFSGESTLVEDAYDNNKETKTIHPNRVNFREIRTGYNHTIFAPGGDRDRPVIKMGIITISRIAKQIVAVFALDRPIKEQLQFYDSIRHFPKEIYVCFNKFDVIKQQNLQDIIEQMKIEDYRNKIITYFKKRHIGIRDVFFTCASQDAQYSEFNDNAAKMILQIAHDQIESTSVNSESRKALIAKI